MVIFNFFSIFCMWVSFRFIIISKNKLWTWSSKIKSYRFDLLINIFIIIIIIINYIEYVNNINNLFVYIIYK